MTMKSHILAALREQFDHWSQLLEPLSEPQLRQSLDANTDWTIKDVLAHLYAWQTRSNARLDTALNNTTPEFPGWPREDSTDEINAWIYQTHQDLSWNEVVIRWKTGYQQLITVAENLTERDLLDSDRYAWLKGYSLADVLLSTYQHHLEHIEDLPTWLNPPV